MKQGSVKTFTTDGATTHTITINEIKGDQATITITSQPVTLMLKVGQTRQADIDQDGNPDISVKLQSIQQETATITITAIPKPATLQEPEQKSPVLQKGEQKPLFDIKINIPDKYETAFPGEDILAEITLINVGATGKVDVEITYTLKNQAGTIIDNHTDTRAVETTTGLTKIFTTPPDAQPGQYTLTAQLKYQQYYAQTTTEITITKRIKYLPAWMQKNYKTIAISSAGTILAIIAILLILKLKKKEEKLEKRMKKLERKR